ncbi:MAG: (2Fe-2S)-binding protein [Acidobacteria bacterium]|nr:(2Fe-2S)-binding protein [Acidobacteriota bacterium]
MAETLTIWVNGVIKEVTSGTTVAAVILNTGVSEFRQSNQGEPRGPLCGIGICYECRVTIDGNPFVRSCQTLCREGMEVCTDG